LTQQIGTNRNFLHVGVIHLCPGNSKEKARPCKSGVRVRTKKEKCAHRGDETGSDSEFVLRRLRRDERATYGAPSRCRISNRDRGNGPRAIPEGASPEHARQTARGIPEDASLPSEKPLFASKNGGSRCSRPFKNIEREQVPRRAAPRQGERSRRAPENKEKKEKEPAKSQAGKESPLGPPPR